MTSKSNIPLLEVDEVKITIIMDNTVDLLMASTEVASRFSSYSKDVLPIAEHGFSALIQVKSGDKQGTVLLDTGMTANGVLHNMTALGIDLSDLQAVVISHGHCDHTLGLPNIIEKLGTQQCSLVLHPDAYLERKIVIPDGQELSISPPQITALRRENISFVENTGPTLLADNMILVSGEIARSTEFEKGFPIHYSNRNGKWENDPYIKDDQCIIMNVRGQGLVVITGCCHSGIINTIRHAQTLTNCQQVYAILGGLHLTGGIFEEIIPATITELQKINPTYLMPGHCTGWSALHQIAQTMPQAFIPNNVGTTVVFQANKKH